MTPSRYPKKYKDLPVGEWTMAQCAECPEVFDVLIMKIPPGDGWARCSECQQKKIEREAFTRGVIVDA